MSDKNFDPKNVTVVKTLTLPNLKAVIEKPIYIKITEPIKRGKLLKEDIEKGKNPDEAAMITNVIDLETGEQCQIVGASLMCSVLIEEYPDHSYVGKAFMATKQKEKGTGAKKYNPWTVVEIDG